MRGNLYLTGFMGSGKSTVGRELARLLGRRFLDLDELIARRLGMDITEAFARLGEAAFRRAESAELAHLAGRSRLVVATGGGAPESAENRRIMRSSGRILHLDASLEVCRQRLGPGEVAARPLWRDEQALQGLYTGRRQAYGECDFNVLTDSLSPQAVVESLGARLLSEERFEVRLGEGACPVAASFRGPAALGELAAGRRVAILTDRRVAGLHLARYQAALGGALVISVPPGEGSKSMAGARRVYEAMLEGHLERGDLLVALGGGMITDLGAFVASTYKRGLDFALASTTLVGCVDAAVGGKSALNLGPAKNMVGLFTVPKLVILDLRALSTLPRGQIAEGLVEAYKTGLVADPELAALVEGELKALLAGDLLALAEVARRSAQAKARVVDADFREAGLRRILNLGHTYGHAVEGFNRYRVSHGQSVAVGLKVAAHISAGRGLISAEQCQRVCDTVGGMQRGRVQWPEAGQAWAIMAHDKKNQGGRVTFVLLAGLGQAQCVQDVEEAELARAVAKAKEG